MHEKVRMTCYRQIKYDILIHDDLVNFIKLKQTLIYKSIWCTNCLKILFTVDKYAFIKFVLLCIMISDEIDFL